MDGTLWYGNGGAGIFHHYTGPFADDIDPVQQVTGQRRFAELHRMNNAMTTFGQTAPTGNAIQDATRAIMEAEGMSFDPPAETLKEPAGWSALSSTQKATIGILVIGAVVGLGWWALSSEEKR